MMAGFPASYFCIKAFSETDQTEDLKKFDVPTLILHGDDDQIVPIQASAVLSSTLIKGQGQVRRLAPDPGASRKRKRRRR
jgi:non-heme chloroperoxidase